MRVCFVILFRCQGCSSWGEGRNEAENDRVLAKVLPKRGDTREGPKEGRTKCYYLKEDFKNDWGEEKWLRAKKWKIGKIVIDSKESVEEKKSAKIGERVQEKGCKDRRKSARKRVQGIENSKSAGKIE